MIFTVLLLALLMAVVVWWLVRQTINVQPWVADESTAGLNHTSFVSADGLRTPTMKLGLGVFLAVATSLFALFISAYFIRMRLGDWRPLPEPSILWWNTAILILSSVCLQWAAIAARGANETALRRGLVAGGICAIAFVAGQLVAWNQLSAAGYYLQSNPANTFFYVLTALHGLHLLGGLIAWGKTMIRAWGETDAGRVQLGTELCAAYWHFLLVVWLVLFGLMLST